MRLMLLVVVAAALSSCWSTPRPAPPRRDADISLAVEQTELANGLRVVVVPEPTVPEVSITVRYGVGAADDPAGKEGIAHLVEHLMFEQARGDEAIFDVLERRALAFNGFTTTDATIYTERAASSQLEEMLEVERARMVGSCTDIPAAAFTRQREIVRNELHEREVEVALDALLESTLFGSRRKLATEESIASITQKDACDFAAAYYGPANAIVVISGAVQLAQIRPLISRTLERAPAVALGGRHAAVVAQHQSVALDAPVDRTWFVLAWPLPADLAGRTRLRAVVGMATALIGSYINGVVSSLEIGAGPSRQIAIAVAPSKEIKASDALENTKDTLTRMGPWFSSGLYEHAKNRAIYRFASSLEPATDRDVLLAVQALADRDVQASMGEAKRALVTMSRDDADALVDTALDPAKATIVTLRPSKTKAAVAVHVSESFREERRRKLEDPAEANVPLTAVTEADPFARADTQTTANGMRVVLLPLSTMPIAEVRLVLPVGTADEPAGQRGIALYAAHALEAPFDTTMFEFVKQGGALERDVSFDQTVFSTRGLANNLDVLLSGVASTIREGGYDTDNLRDTANWLALTSAGNVDRVATSAWREAVYGVNHPYRFASQRHHIDRSAYDLRALQAFRSAHYLPSGATLIISGNFDPEDAQRWIDYHFHEWSGAPASRRSPAATPRALTFAQYGDASQVALMLAFALPAGVGGEIVTEMVNESIADVREELAASYGLHAVLVRERLATRLEISGFVDASRTTDALTLLRDRLTRLRAHDDATASLFVSARRRVVARLSSVDTRADVLADRVTDTLASGDALNLLDRADARHARTTTIDQMTPFFENLDIANAAILMRGPATAVTGAYATLGRTPVVLH